jgi:hypothetical protein
MPIRDLWSNVILGRASIQGLYIGMSTYNQTDGPSELPTAQRLYRLLRSKDAG